MLNLRVSPAFIPDRGVFDWDHHVTDLRTSRNNVCNQVGTLLVDADGEFCGGLLGGVCSQP
jgi:hypothetical protein